MFPDTSCLPITLQAFVYLPGNSQPSRVEILEANAESQTALVRHIRDWTTHTVRYSQLMQIKLAYPGGEIVEYFGFARNMPSRVPAFLVEV
jgi:hypothetical protein